MTPITLLSLLVVAVMSQNYQVSLTFPSVMDNNRTNINYIGSDFQGNFLVSLENSQGRKYDSAFSSYQNFTMPEVADKLTGVSQLVTGLKALDGSNLTSNSSVISSLSNQKKTINIFDYSSFTILDSLTVPQPINYLHVIPLNISAVHSQFYFLYCQDSLKFSYNNILTDILFYNSNETNYDVQFKATSTIMVLNNLVKMKIDTYLLQSGNKLYASSITALLQYDPSTNTFSYMGYENVVMTLIHTTAFQGTKLHQQNQFLIIQSSSGSAMYNTATSQPGTASNFSPIRVFFYIFSKYYALLQNGLAIVSYNSGSNSMSMLALSIPLLSNLYDLSPGNSNIDPFYIVGQPYVYKSGQCPGQTLIGIGSLCISYSCLVANCDSCPFSPLICGVCKDGYYKAPLLGCLKSPTTTTNTTTNTTLNSTINATSNSTANTTTNSTQSNSSSTTTPMTPTISNNTVIVYFISRALFLRLQAIFQSLTKVTSAVISVPAARKVVSPLFYYFGVFDDIYLYQFHDRLYGNTMNAVFEDVNQIQSKKWSCLTFQNIIQFFKGNPQEVNDKIDYQANYISYEWETPNHPNLGSESLFGTSQNFFFTAIPLACFCFILFRMLYRLLSRYPCSKVVRRFNFLIFLPILLFEGNVQQFSFFLTRDLTYIFSFTLPQKLIKVFIIFFGLTVVLYSVAVYLLSYIAYKRLNRYFMQNNRNNLTGILLLGCQNGLKNMLLGVLQAVMRPLPYPILLSVIIATEIGFCSIFICSIRAKFYRSHIRIWIYITLNFIKILLLCSFALDHENYNLPPIETLQQILMFFIILMFLLGICTEIIYTLFECHHFIANFVRKICNKPSKAQTRVPSIEEILNKLGKVPGVRRPERKKGIKIQSLSTLKTVSRPSIENLLVPRKPKASGFKKPEEKLKVSVGKVTEKQVKDKRLKRYQIYKIGIKESNSKEILAPIKSNNQQYMWTIKQQ